jgi:hypothetical protein
MLKNTGKVIKGVTFSINIQGLLHRNIKHPGVVQPKSMVYVVVRKQYCITSSKFFFENLLAKVGGCVNENNAILSAIVCKTNTGAAAKPFVFGVVACTHITVTCNDWDSG